jgi:hypothetical protein
MARKFVSALTIVGLLAACSTGSAIAAGQIITQGKDTPPTQTEPAAPEKKAKKNILGGNPQKPKYQEGWAARDLRKKGYDPQNMTGKDFRKMMGVE